MSSSWIICERDTLVDYDATPRLASDGPHPVGHEAAKGGALFPLVAVIELALESGRNTKPRCELA